MKKRQSLISIIGLCCVLSACSKSSTTGNSPTLSSFYFSANDSLVIFTLNTASIEEVVNTRTTLITGQFADTVKQKGSISIRVLGDTTGRYSGDSLLVTYISSAGVTYYNTSDSSNYVMIDKYQKKYNGEVSGKFSLKVTNGSSGIQFNNGSFVALYQE